MSKVYRVLITDNARKELASVDPTPRAIILKWLNKNLEGCENPRAFGKPLADSHSGEWVYRIGSYRVLAVIYDDSVVVEVFKVGHRGKVYRWR